LSLPEAVFDTYEEYVLHPSLLTGVFQIALISNRFYKREPGLQFIPMSIGSIRVYHPIPKRCYVYAKADQDTLNNPKIRKFNLDILDQDGKICVTLRDFAIRSLVRAKTDQKPVAQESSKVRVKETAESQTVKGIDQANVEEFLKSLVASTLEMNSNDIEAQVKFEKYGINSVMIMQLNRVLESSFGPLSKTLFFEYSNIAELATYFLKKHKEKLRSLIQADGNSP